MESFLAAHAKAALRTGWTFSGLVIAFMLFDSIIKLIKIEPVVQSFQQLGYPDSIARTILEDEFRQRGLTVPDAAIATYSMQLRLQLLATGGYVTVMTEYSYCHGADRWGLHALPLECSQRLPVVIQRLRHRLPTPVVERFLRSARTVILGSSRG